MKVYEISGIRRSGIHAIAFWMMERLPNCVLVNNIDEFLENNTYQVFKSTKKWDPCEPQNLPELL